MFYPRLTRRRSRNQAPVQQQQQPQQQQLQQQPTLAARPRDDVIMAQSTAPTYARSDTGPFYTQQPVPVQRDVREDPFKTTERQLKEVSDL